MSVLNFPEGRNYRTEIVCSGGSQISGNVTNHIQVLNLDALSISGDSANVFDGEARADHFFEDAVFTLDSAGSVILDFEIQHFDWISQEVWVHVRIPTYTTATFSIYFWRSYWKDSLIDRIDPYGSDDCFASFTRVLHLNEASGEGNPTDWSPFNESCEYKSDLPRSDSAETAWATAPIYKPQTTQGGNDRVDIGSVGMVSDADESFSCGGWYAPYNFDSDRYLWGIRNGVAGDGIGCKILTNGKVFVVFDSGDTFVASTDGTPIPTADIWYHIWVTYDGSRNTSGLKIYVNGVSQTLSFGGSGAGWPITGNTSNAENFAICGISGVDVDDTFRGCFQEFRYMSTVASADYIKLMYETQANISTYATPQAPVFVGKTLADDWEESTKFAIDTIPANIPSSETNFLARFPQSLISATDRANVDPMKLRASTDIMGANEIPVYCEYKDVDNFVIWVEWPDFNDTDVQKIFFWPTLKVDTEERQPIPTRALGFQGPASRYDGRAFIPMDEPDTADKSINLARYDYQGDFYNGVPDQEYLLTPAQFFNATNDIRVQYDDALGVADELFVAPWSISAEVAFVNATDDSAIMGLVEETGLEGFSIRISRDGSSNKKIYFVLRDRNNPGNAIIVHGDTLIDDQEIATVALEWDGTTPASNVKMYVNGVLQTLTIIEDTLNGDNKDLTGWPFQIGRRADNREMNGHIDTVKFTYNKNFGANWQLLTHRSYQEPELLFVQGEVFSIPRVERGLKRGIKNSLKRGTWNG